jgi:hypothetical protein
MDEKNKNDDGEIYFPGGKCVLDQYMQKHAGERVTIQEVHDRGVYYLKELDQSWEDWMFDPDYRPEDEPLSARDAILAMLDGEKLYDKEGHWAAFNDEKDCFEYEGPERNIVKSEVKGFSRRPARRKRPMTRWEILAWANSEASRGWVVRYMDHRWQAPQISYGDNLEMYQCARLLPDLSGIDESTVQGFEVEE